MKYLRVNTDVYNEACQEERELVFKNKETLTATVKFNDEASYVWATRFDDGRWSFSIAGLTLDDVNEKTMLLLLQKINLEMGENNVA